MSLCYKSKSVKQFEGFKVCMYVIILVTSSMKKREIQRNIDICDDKFDEFQLRETMMTILNRVTHEALHYNTKTIVVTKTDFLFFRKLTLSVIETHFFFTSAASELLSVKFKQKHIAQINEFS